MGAQAPQNADTKDEWAEKGSQKWGKWEFKSPTNSYQGEWSEKGGGCREKWQFNPPPTSHQGEWAEKDADWNGAMGAQAPQNADTKGEGLKKVQEKMGKMGSNPHQPATRTSRLNNSKISKIGHPLPAHTRPLVRGHADVVVGGWFVGLLCLFVPCWVLILSCSA
jgi:hypothetical protein